MADESTAPTSNAAVSFSKWRANFYLGLLVATQFTGALCFSLQAPIYPREAAAKGVQASQYGFVFGVFQLVVFLSSPIYGIYAKSIGPIFMYTSGVFISAGCAILFGFLDKSPPGSTFFALSIAVRAVGAFGDSAVYTAGLMIASQLYPNAMATAIAIVETSFGIGVIVGPPVGGYLYDVGGFSLPFFVFGGISMLLCFVTVIAFQSLNFGIVESRSEGPKLLKVARNPFFIITSYSVFVVPMTVRFIQALLEPHLKSLNLSDANLGLIFMALGGCYAISGIVFGRVADKVGHFNLMSIVGLVISIIGVLLLGPAPFIHLQISVGLVVPALCLCGIGIGCVLMSSVMELIKIAAGGGPPNMATKGFVSGFYNSIAAFGSFIGPTIGGPLFDAIGFSWTSMVFLGLELIALALVLGIVIFKLLKKVQNKEVPQIN